MTNNLDGKMYARMISAGADNLRAHAKEVNDLNVFPIPDGDTGDNMLLTIMGGVESEETGDIGKASRRAADGMLLSARGNSGVILSQFFEGMTDGFSGLDEADAATIGSAFRKGVIKAYEAVIEPCEGTILTVIREATEFACRSGASCADEFLDYFIAEAKRSLERTPELLPVLKKAGVVDSGGAGLIYIIDGMRRALTGESVGDGSYASGAQKDTVKVDLNAFGEDSVLEYGYCTELLLRLQNSKTDISSFDMPALTEFLQSVGDSVVAVRNGSVVKLHVHTMTPYKVLEYCQRFGEYLTVKIENMSLQHNSISEEIDEKEECAAESETERKRYGVVAVVSGDGLKQTMLERGVDVIVDGGQSMNPSAEAFLEAFDKVNADHIFVFPNNGNVILTARQAAKLYQGSDVRVIESRTVGEGYASLAMLNTWLDDPDEVERELKEAMEGVVTAEISRCVRDAELDGRSLHTGDYIGFSGKSLLASSTDRLETLLETVKGAGLKRHDICIIIVGCDADAEEAKEAEKLLKSQYRGKEIYIIDGGQDVYDYIIILE